MNDVLQHSPATLKNQNNNNNNNNNNIGIAMEKRDRLIITPVSKASGACKRKIFTPLRTLQKQEDVIQVRRSSISGADPTILSYNASAVNIYNATNSTACF
jgi:hypothetical protein